MDHKIAQKLDSLEKWIFACNHTHDEWLAAEKDFFEMIKEYGLTSEDMRAFVESGAGETMSMACDAIRLIRGKKSQEGI